jgi:predicted TIM-barrel fold metal-dependent hydrolase
MIDSHLHVVVPRLPGVGSLSPLLEQDPEEVAAALREEMQEAGITAALAMGSANGPDDDPLGVNRTLDIARSVPGLNAIGVANPLRGDLEHMRRVEKVIHTGRVRALKVYLGYLHFPPDHAGYRPYYELAERHNLPVIFHTGDTYSPYAKVRFAQPLLVDDVAVDHPKVRFVLAHAGNPWLLDAAEVIYKNMNVWADLSGLMVGQAEVFHDEDNQEALRDLVSNLQRAFRYAERPNRFLFGSDWPLAPLAAYREFIARALPETYHSLIFADNARVLFRI